MSKCEHCGGFTDPCPCDRAEIVRLRAENAALKAERDNAIERLAANSGWAENEEIGELKERIASLERVAEAFLDNITDDGRSYCCGCDFQYAHKLAKEALGGEGE